MAALEGAFSNLYSNSDQSLPSDSAMPPLERTTLTAKGRSGNDIALHITRPANATGGTLPAVVYIHGGAMIMVSTLAKFHTGWTKDIAAQGAIAVNLDFRNSDITKPETAFPAGLHDCIDAVKFLHAKKKELGIGSIVLQGESGGANLSIATTLSLRREGLTNIVDGVYCLSPYLSGAYGETMEWKLEHLPSLVECDGYFLNVDTIDYMAAAYDPYGKSRQSHNPLAWPYWVSEDELNGFPPTVVVMNELDPLRDEGAAFLRKCQRAGVKVVGRMNYGLCHAIEFMLRKELEADHFATVRGIVAFARGFM